MNTKADNDILMVAMMNMLLLLMDIYITEEIPKREQLTERLRYNKFLFWLRKRHLQMTKGKTNEKPNHTTNRTVSRSNTGPTGIVPRSG
jgi:hypothetical protein